MNTRDQISFFDHMCEVWDEISRPNEEKIEFLLDKIALKQADSVLDVGTGTGVLLPYISGRTSNGKIDAVDYSSGMLRVAHRKFGHLSHISFFERDIELCNIPTRYNKIILYSVFPHLVRKTETISYLINNNLIPGGRLIIAHADSRRFLNQMHKQKDSRVKEAALLSVALQKFFFKEAELSVIDAFENNDYYYLILENNDYSTCEKIKEEYAAQPI